MAENLVKKGHSLVVFDVVPSSVEHLVSAGAKAASSPVEVAKQVDTFITMLPSSSNVKEVCVDKGVFAAAKPGTLFLDCSTIDPSVSRELACAAAGFKLRMLDCPVSGGVGGAAAGTLTFMVGGTPADFAAAKPFLEAMGKKIVHCGEVGTGQVAKICNNLILGISMTAVSEAMNLGVRMGIDPKTLADIINTSSGRCWSSDTYNPCPGVMENVPSSKGYTGGFGVPLMKKDLGLAVDAAKAVNAPLALGSLTHSIYTLMTNSGYAAKDFSSVFQMLAAGTPPKKE